MLAPQHARRLFAPVHLAWSVHGRKFFRPQRVGATRRLYCSCPVALPAKSMRTEGNGLPEHLRRATVLCSDVLHCVALSNADLATERCVSSGAATLTNTLSTDFSKRFDHDFVLEHRHIGHMQQYRSQNNGADIAKRFGARSRCRRF